jgi:hypothetical protein
MVLTFPDERNPETALGVAKNFLLKEFPEAKAIVSIHTDTKNLHCHVWLDARLITGKKLDLGTKYRQLDKLFARHHDQIYGTNYATEYAARQQANRAERHKKEPDWRLLKTNEQTRIDGRKRDATIATRVESIARMDTIDRVLEPPSGETNLRMVGGSKRNTQSNQTHLKPATPF